MKIFTEQADQLCRTLPHPIASSYFWFRFRNASENPYQRIERANQLVETIFRYSASLCLSAYRKDRLSNPIIDEAIAELIKPSLGTWNKLIRLILNRYNRTEFPIPGLPEAWNRSIGPCEMTAAQNAIPALAGMDYKPTGAANVLRFFDFLVVFRNAMAHRGLANLSKGTHKEINMLMEPALDELVVELGVLMDWPPVAFAGWEGNRILYDLLQGASTDFRQGLARWRLEREPVAGDVYLCQRRGDDLQMVMRMFPIAWHSECPQCKGDRFFFLNELGREDKGDQYVSLRCGHSVRRVKDDPASGADDWPISTGTSGPRRTVGFRGDSGVQTRSASSLPRDVEAENPLPIEIPEPLQLAYRIVAHSHSLAGEVLPRGSRQLRSGESLTEGDGFQVIMELSKGANVCLLWSNGEGRCRVLYPGRQGGVDPFLLGGKSYLFPGSGDWYTLDGHPGLETLWLIVDEQPLDDLLSATARRVDSGEIDNDPIMKAIESRSQGVGFATGREAASLDRSGLRSVGGVDRIVQAGQGCTSIVEKFEIEHRPRPDLSGQHSDTTGPI